jgi:cadmium resistance protein CadD (predicted permease)
MEMVKINEDLSFKAFLRAIIKDIAALRHYYKVGSGNRGSLELYFGFLITITLISTFDYFLPKIDILRYVSLIPLFIGIVRCFYWVWRADAEEFRKRIG